MNPLMNSPINTAIKALDGDGWRVGGYLVVWGGPAQKDLTGEWFDPQTGGLLDFFQAVGKLPVLYDHARDGRVKAVTVGVIDGLSPDEVGLWASAVIDRRNRYAAAVRDLVMKGALSWSSGALPQAVKRRQDGYIQRWPIIEGSMTPTPAEPRFTQIGHAASIKAVVAACKSIGIDSSLFKAVEVSSMDDQAEFGNLHDQVAAAVSSAVAPLRDEVTALRAAVTSGTATRALPEAARVLPSPAANVRVTRATKYSDLSAMDMAFLYEVMNPHYGMRWNPGEEFFRELADKSFKAVERHELPFSAVKGLVDAGYTKSNELMNTAQTGYGLEWVPDSWRAELWLRVRQDNVVAPLFTMLEMATNPYELPFETTDPTVYLAPETTAQAQLALTSANPIPESKAGSGKVQMSAKKLALRIAWSTEQNEDSIIPVVEIYRRQAIRAMQNAIDNVCLNGDTATSATTNVNLIDGTPGGTEKYLASDGLRKYCLVTNTGQLVRANGAPTLNLMRQTRWKLDGAYALQPANCAFLVGNSTYAALLNLPEFLTMDKIGPQATNLTGQIGVIDGVPVFASAELALSQTGLVAAGGGKISATPGNNTRGQALCLFRPNWILGYRRQVTADVERIGWADAYHLVVTARICTVSFGGSTQSAAELYDVAV